MKTKSENDYRVMETMEKYGGSFVKALAYAMHRADDVNFKKLQEAFPEYWKQYSQMYKNDSKEK